MWTILEVQTRDYTRSRAFFSKESSPFDLEGPLLEDVCRLDRFVLNGVDVNIKMYSLNPLFCLMSGEKNQKYKNIFDDVIFKESVRRHIQGV